MVSSITWNPLLDSNAKVNYYFYTKQSIHNNLFYGWPEYVLSFSLNLSLISKDDPDHWNPFNVKDGAVDYNDRQAITPRLA